MAQYISKVLLKKFLRQLLIKMIKNILQFSKKIVLASILFFGTNIALSAKGMPDEYYKIKDIQKQKKYFFNYMYMLIEKENLRILKERELVKSVLFSNILSINFDSPRFQKFLEIKNKYKIKKLFTPTDYLKRIDIIPSSMALAQAAVESGWGKSRFIKEANNIFGHWTYNPRIGLLPQNREIGATHFIRIFQSLTASISAYALNLNRNFAYKDFRENRYLFRLKDEKLNGLLLSQTMLNYSGIAHEYLKILQNVIETNNLTNYDTKFNTNLNSK